MRTIAHLDMDAFYASIELQRRPELKGKAMVVSGSSPRAVVTTASYEARIGFGVGSAMPLSRARRLCPDLIVFPPDFTHYRDISRKIMAILRANVESVEVVGLDEAYLDLTGYMAPNAAMQGIRAEIREQTGLTCSIGRGPNKLIAKIASGLEKPEGTVVITQEQARERFANNSPRLLPGIGPKTSERLASMGIDTIAKLAGYQLSELQSTFGERQGVYYYRRARFEDESPVTSERETKSQSCETTFDFDITDRDRLLSVLNKLTTTLCERLRANELVGKNVAIKVRLNDWTTVTRTTTLDSSTNDAAILAPVALGLLKEYDPTRPVRLLGVRVAGLETSGAKTSKRPSIEGQLQLEL